MRASPRVLLILLLLVALPLRSALATIGLACPPPYAPMVAAAGDHDHDHGPALAAVAPAGHGHEGCEHDTSAAQADSASRTCPAACCATLLPAGLASIPGPPLFTTRWSAEPPAEPPDRVVAGIERPPRRA